MFKDENGNLYTEEELREQFEELKQEGETDCETFEEYVRNCTDKNGTLERVEIKGGDEMKEEIMSIFQEMDDSEIVRIWNEYCYESNNYDDQIMDYDTINEIINNSGEDGLYWVNRFFYGSDDYGDGSANPNRNYFTFNGYGNIESFDYIYNSYSDEFHHIDIDSLIDYIVENRESFSSDEIEEVFEIAEA